MMTEIPLVKVQEVPSHASTLQLFIQKMLQICRKHCTNHSVFRNQSLQSGKLSLKKINKLGGQKGETKNIVNLVHKQEN